MEGLPKYLIVFIHFLRPARRERGGEGEGEKAERREAAQEKGEEGHGEEERAEGGRKERKEKGRLFGIPDETSLEPLSVPSLEKYSQAKTVSEIAEGQIDREREMSLSF